MHSSAIDALHSSRLTHSLTRHIVLWITFPFVVSTYEEPKLFMSLPIIIILILNDNKNKSTLTTIVLDGLHKK